MIASRDGWIGCPYCGNRYLKRIFPDENCERLNVFCRKCKRDLYITIRHGQSFYSQAP